ncbi:hypothetical protein [Xanthomonas phaseoli]|uniref:hypothetical protein n=1 Tax=Xanthomonas phaseoli TaxID=1985254 RepID=UPI0002F8DF2D|nr:hypothetical protein [Xanthomonas phaseoli]RWU19448.1 hypothetical protein XANMN_02555 [Xanthomonas phaseoli pv. manihotis str. CIO151]
MAVLSSARQLALAESQHAATARADRRITALPHYRITALPHYRTDSSLRTGNAYGNRSADAQTAQLQHRSCGLA